MRDKQRDKVVALKAHGWMRRQALAQTLGITVRTVDRRVKAGTVERRKSGQSHFYRVVSLGNTRETERHRETFEGQQRDIRETPERHSGFNDADQKNLSALVLLQGQELAELRKELAKVRGHLSLAQSLQEATDRLVEVQRSTIALLKMLK